MAQHQKQSSSDTIPAHLMPVFKPIGNPAAIVEVPNFRVTVLTDRLLRMEYSPMQTFEDRPSQAFWFREQPRPEFATRFRRGNLVVDPIALRNGDVLEVETAFLKLVYVIGNPVDAETAPGALTVELKELGVTWHDGLPAAGNLLGTYRTLDTADGHVPLGQGLLSRDGWVVVDDVKSLVFTRDGWLTARGAASGTRDLYFFGYGTAFQDCLRDFRKIAGPVPLIPRYILGNWWSRYWEYSQEEIIRLIQEFQANQVPLSVFIIDMDWHITRTGNTASGWTGYTWNKQLFPDYKALLKFIHQQGLRTALNLHPADGVHPHEEQYPKIAQTMGLDPATGQPIPFDLADPKFSRAYFEHLHHPYEADGIDFWWIDWQQGTLSSLPGLDPLWWLNHLHYYDLAREGEKRPFVFSRWGGLGNHRYPIGFSGDTIVSWDSLAFQPYFTATAANVGYSWWSHDIGGHFGGVEDPELYLRWVQYGLFSPILRLHSTKNPFHERRPYAYDAEIRRLARQAMQYRHAFIPYLYSMAWRDHQEAEAPIRPLYHLHPEAEQAYHYPNVYTYGSELIAAPFTSPLEPATRLARQPIWLPPGDWFQFFTGAYTPGGHHTIYGTLEDVPLFAKAGAIIPLATLPGWGGVDNPDHLRLHVFPGADNRFELYEDDGKTGAYQDGKYALTPFSVKWEESSLNFTIEPVQGDLTQCPAVRTYELKFRGIRQPDQVLLRYNRVKHTLSADYDPETETLTVPIPFEVRPTDVLIVSLQMEKGGLMTREERTLPTCRKLLAHFRLETGTKSDISAHLPELVEDPVMLARYRPTLKDGQLLALLETITRTGVHWFTQAGSDEVVLWNDNAEKTIRPVMYQLAVNQNWWPYRFPERNYLEGGAVPAFKAFNIAEQFLKHPWRLRLDYFGALSVELGREEGYRRAKE